jgi:hypothetical protein
VLRHKEKDTAQFVVDCDSESFIFVVPRQVLVKLVEWLAMLVILLILVDLTQKVINGFQPALVIMSHIL